MRAVLAEVRNTFGDHHNYLVAHADQRPITAADDGVRPEDRALHAADWAALALPGLIWGSSFFLIAEGLESFAPFLVTWMRLLFGFAVIAATPTARRPDRWR